MNEDWLYSYYHGIQKNTLEQFIDDSNNISTCQAFQQNKESINAIKEKMDEANVEIDRYSKFRQFQAQHINPAPLKISKSHSLLHCLCCELQGFLLERFFDAVTSFFCNVINLSWQTSKDLISYEYLTCWSQQTVHAIMKTS